MHKSDVKVMKVLYENDSTTELKSSSILQILSKLNCSYSKAHNDLNKLVIAEYVQKGFKSERADTYFITTKGIDKLRGLIK